MSEIHRYRTREVQATHIPCTLIIGSHLNAATKETIRCLCMANNYYEVNAIKLVNLLHFIQLANNQLCTVGAKYKNCHRTLLFMFLFVLTKWKQVLHSTFKYSNFI